MLLRFIVTALWLATAPVLAGQVDFTLPDLHGAAHKLSDYRGKWVVVNYWASWCPPCLDEIPDLIDFHARHKDKDAVVLGVDFEDIPNEQLASFVQSMGMTYPVLRDKPGPRSILGLTVPGLPTSFIVDPGGNLVGRRVGPLTLEALEKLVAGHQGPSGLDKRR